MNFRTVLNIRALQNIRDEAAEAAVKESISGIRSLLLDENWDLAVSNRGDLAVIGEPIRQAQDVATRCRTFRGECVYAQAQGIPYFADVLGKTPPDALVRDYIHRESLEVPGVQEAYVTFAGLEGRKLTGDIRITDSEGNTQYVSIT